MTADRLIYLSPVPWDSHWQRPHEFVQWFRRRTGGEVDWVEPYATRLPMLADVRRPRQSAGELQPPPWMRLHRVRAVPVEPLPGLRVLNSLGWRPLVRALTHHAPPGTLLVIGKPSRLARDLLAHGRDMRRIYDAMDNFPAFYAGYSRMALASTEDAIVRGTDLVLASTRPLQERLERSRTPVRLVPNACATEQLPPPGPPASAAGPVVLGYVGTIGHWFDWPLVIRLATCHPQARVRLIGPQFISTPGDLPPNVELAGGMTRAAALREMAAFDVGLVPFLVTPLTECVDPIKYYEYRALGIPVLSTPFGSMVGRDGVGVAEADTDLVAEVARLRGTRLSATDAVAFRAANSWTARFDDARLLS